MTCHDHVYWKGRVRLRLRVTVLTPEHPSYTTVRLKVMRVENGTVVWWTWYRMNRIID